MSETASQRFAAAAHRPLRQAVQRFVADDVGEGLQELRADRLAQALDKGVEAVAHELGLPTKRVAAALPLARVDDERERVAASQPEAVVLWKRHGDPALLEGIAKVTAGGELVDAAAYLDQLARRARGPLGEGLERLLSDMARWSGQIATCQGVVADGARIEEARHRSGRPLRLLSALAGVALLFGAVHFARGRIAQTRIADVLATMDWCQAARLDQGTVAHASSAQREQLAGAQKACEAQVESKRREEEARKREEERKRKIAEARARLLARCKGIGAGLKQKDAAALAALGDKALAPRLGRVAGGELTEDDLGADWSSFVCRDVPGGVDFAVTFTRLALAGALGWVKTTVPSDSTAELMKLGAPKLTKAETDTFVGHVERYAKFAVESEAPAVIAQAARLCRFLGKAGFAGRKRCDEASRKVKPEPSN